jgi:hypothetical protein
VVVAEGSVPLVPPPAQLMFQVTMARSLNLPPGLMRDVVE